MSQSLLKEKWLKQPKLEILKIGKFQIRKSNLTKLTSGLLRGKHISSEEILTEYESRGGRH